MFAISMEMTSLPSYVLAGFRKTNRLGAEASLKYVLFGAACNALMIYGISMLYGISGSLQFEALANGASSPLFAIGLFGVLVGLGFKIAAVPFHFWCPDVFEGAAIDVSAFLSVASKGAALIALLRIAENLSAVAPSVPIILGIAGAITASVGNTAALIQNNVKRLLGYSSIAQAGYIICAIAAVFAVPAADVTPVVLQYLLIYLFMNLGAFTVAAVVGKQQGQQGEQVEAFAGLSRRSPMLALSMTACLISLIGLPPLAGFNVKLNVMLLLGHAGGWWWVLVAVIGINTVLSMYFYLRIVKTMYFDPSDLPPPHRNVTGIALSGACAIALVLSFLAFGSITRLTSSHGQLLPPDPSPTSVQVTAQVAAQVAVR
jgi:NADH-quinone oxidoreductase subunit N